MKITTKQFAVSKKEYLLLLIHHFRKRKWWIWIIVLMNLVFALVAVFALHATISLLWIALGFTVLYFGVFLLSLYMHVNGKNSAAVYESVHFEFYDDVVHTYLADGSNGKLQCSQFVRTVKLKDYYLLYLSAGQFLMIPFYCFEDEKDLAAFDAWLRKNKMLKN